MTKTPSPRPLSIKVIAALFAAAAISFLFSLQAPALFFGTFILGPTALVNNIVMVLLEAYLAINLWKLHERARRIAIGVDCYWALNTVLAVIKYWTVADSAFMGYCIVQLAIIAPALWFLIKRKSAFVRPAND